MSHHTPRFVLVRLCGLILLLVLALIVFRSRAQEQTPSATDRALTPEDIGIPGATGDGTADDSTAIQAWIDAGGVGQGDLQLPAGTYRITQPLHVTLADKGPVSIHGNGVCRIIMDGPGPALRITGTHGGTADPDTVQPGVWEHERMPLVDGIEIVGGHPEAVGIELDGTMQATITRITVRDALHAIHVVTRNRNIQISDCHLYHNTGVGVYLEGVNLHQINIVGCHISYNGQGGIVCRDCEIRNLQIGTCDIEANMALDGPPTANILLDCRSGSVREGAIVGCTIQHDHDAPDSANIRMLGQSPENSLKVGNFAISDNVFSDVQCNIHLQFARGVTITGNVFWEGYEHNLLCENCSDLVIGPNLFDRNPDYDPQDKGSANAIIFRNCRDCTLTGLHVNSNHGTDAAVTLDRCQWFNVTGCSVFDSDGIGIWLDRCAHSRVSDCLIRDERRDDAVLLKLSECEDVKEVDNLVGGMVVVE
jgi:polygalacturonase